MAETFLRAAVTAVKQGGWALHQTLDTLPVPIYATDAAGAITYYNRACIDFAGRTPCIGADRWCVAGKLYTKAGAVLPHDQSPMAAAIQERRPISGNEAIAERPDGTRVNFLPYATPLFDEDGNLVGAVNLLIDTTGSKRTWTLWESALRCRRLAGTMPNPQAAAALVSLAAEYEQKAREAESGN